jgi:hypothetical protein
MYVEFLVESRLMQGRGFKLGHFTISQLLPNYVLTYSGWRASARRQAHFSEASPTGAASGTHSRRFRGSDGTRVLFFVLAVLSGLHMPFK